MSSIKQPLPGVKGSKTRIKVARLRTGDRSRPADATLALSATAAVSATRISLSAFTTNIAAGQFLAFENSAGQIFRVQVAANSTGGTALDVAPLAEPFTTSTGVTAFFPVRFDTRQDSQFQFSTNISDFSTYAHDGASDATPGETTGTVNAGGAYSFYDAGGATVELAQKQSAEIWIEQILDVPDAGLYSKGEVRGSACLISQMDISAPNSGTVTFNMQGRLVGTLDRKDPTPIS